MLSGLVPLNADFMRYSNSVQSRQRCHEDHFEQYSKEINDHAKSITNITLSRSEIALQAQSFGAELRTK